MQVQLSVYKPAIRSFGFDRCGTEMNLRKMIGAQNLGTIHGLLNLRSRILRCFGSRTRSFRASTQSSTKGSVTAHLRTSPRSELFDQAIAAGPATPLATALATPTVAPQRNVLRPTPLSLSVLSSISPSMVSSNHSSTELPRPLTISGACAHHENDSATPKPRLSDRTSESSTEPNASAVIFEAEFCHAFGKTLPALDSSENISLSCRDGRAPEYI